MKYLLLTLLFFAFSLSPVFALKELKRQFEPTDKISLRIAGKLMIVPYAYLEESYNVNLKKEGIVKVDEDKLGEINLKYLYPSLAPPSDHCDLLKKFCEGEPIGGFKPPPKSQKQFYVMYNIYSFTKDQSYADNIYVYFYSKLAEKNKRLGFIRERADLGLIENKIPGSDATYYIPIKPLQYRTYISCFVWHCILIQEDDEAKLVHHMQINKSEFAHWREYLATRFEILKKFPLE